MKTSGATRKKPSQTKPGSPQASVIQPPPRPRPPACRTPSARSLCAPTSCSASSISATSISGAGSGVEELDILLLPGDPDLLTLLAAEGGIAVARHLRQHALASRGQVQLDEIAQELDEDDLALDRVAGRGAVAPLVHLDRGGTDRHERRLADGRRLEAVRPDAHAHLLVVLDH